MRRIHFLQRWYGYSDPGREEALHDISVLRRFAGRFLHSAFDT
jgi:IS5 family transposase